MNYQHMSEELTNVSDNDASPSPDSKANYKSTHSTSPLSPTTKTSPAILTPAPETSPAILTPASETPPATIPQTTITITREGAQIPDVLAVHTSSTLSSPASPPAAQPNGAEHPGQGITNVMTSQQAFKRRTISQEKYEEVDSSVPPTNLQDFEDPAGDRYVKHTSKLEQVRSRVKWLIDHIFFRAFTIILILIDLSIVITAVAKSSAAADNLDPKLIAELHRLDLVALVFSCYFMVEVGLRIFTETPKLFFRQILEIVDGIVVLTSFIVVIIDLAIDSTATEFVKIIAGLRLVRLVRFGMLLRVIITQRMRLMRSARLLVSENKRRYQRDGFDLDLCYVTDHAMAMSFPSQGFMSIYRNPIEEVSRFFNTKYYNKYRIYNCCSERGYDENKFFNDSVVRVMIDDHNVPSLRQIVDFIADVERWMLANKNHVIAIHCKGGKGRTGTMIAIWLLHTGTFKKADDALDYFGTRRTDLSVDSKFQGVETPSQSRYVNYYEKMLANYDGKIPEETKVRPTKISVSGLRGIGNGDGRDLIVQFVVRGDVVYEAKFGTDTNCTTVFERESATITASLANSPILSGDVKVRFEATSKIPCAYDGCPWFFWFNTSFIEDSRLSLGREDLDNPHQKKAWKLYKEDFGVNVHFDDSF